MVELQRTLSYAVIRANRNVWILVSGHLHDYVGLSCSYVAKIAIFQHSYVFYVGFEEKEVKNLDQNLTLT
jgi:hypothetical protein